MQVDGMAVIAPSVSAQMTADDIVQRNSWTVTKPKYADGVLVVVRSSLYDPLMQTYKCCCKLAQDANMQLNISGPKYHVYVYSIDGDLKVTQVQHKPFAAE